MKKYYIIGLFLFLSISNISFPQDSNKVFIDGIIIENPLDNKYSNYFFNNSFGYSFESAKPAISLSLSRRISKRIFLGIKGGVLENSQKINDQLYDAILPFYNTLPAGYYQIKNYGFNVNGMNMIGSILMNYQISDIFLAELNTGVKFYKSKTYKTDFYFSKSTNTTPLIIDRISNISDNPESKLIFKAYFGAGINMKYSNLLFGLYVDNLVSVGFNAGIFF
jgi:hypothetical protein